MFHGRLSRRWRQAYQHDFAARMDWSNTSEFEEVNHPPIAKLSHSNELIVYSGDIISLNADGSSDPDGDELNYHWIYYREVGTLNPSPEFEVNNQQKISFETQEVQSAKTAHFILEVTDNGTPALSRYQRVIVNILPKK